MQCPPSGLHASLQSGGVRADHSGMPSSPMWQTRGCPPALVSEPPPSLGPFELCWPQPTLSGHSASAS